ncbi:kinase-like domain-containing protein [Globomyces pollinis-pini]|nr:kinase-like domain-containing protein [Globomyces pollinis-pini]
MAQIATSPEPQKQKDKSQPNIHSEGYRFPNVFHRKSKEQNESSYLTANVSDYEIIRKICGIEDVSFLVLAKHQPTQKMVSLKITDLTLSPDNEFIEEIIKSIKNNRMLHHKNILPNFLSFINDDELYSITLPLYGTLRGIMKDNFENGFSEVVVATIIKEVLKALQYLHENHIIHNDIRSDNIVIDEHGDVKLTGFRQMRILQHGGQMSKTAFSLVGDNIEWAAPEVMSQNVNYDASADMYSMGITAMELGFNQTPFDGWPPLKVLLCKQHYECPAIKSTKTFSKHFYKFVQSCAHKVPSERPKVTECLEHAFIKQSKNSSYLEQSVIKRCKQLQSAHSSSSISHDLGSPTD